MIAAIVLAAGAGRRMGNVAKATLVMERETFLGRVSRLATEAGVGPQLVVVGEPHRAETEREARRLQLPVVANPAPARGMGSSVAVGFAAAIELFPDVAAALLWPVDHVRVRPSTLRELCARVSPGRVIIPVRDGRGGHPVLVGRSLWTEMTRAGDLPQGARSVWQANARSVHRIIVDDDGILADVDRPADME